MDIGIGEIDKEFYNRRIKGVDWKSISPEIAKILVSPSFYLTQAQLHYQRKIRELLVDFDVTETQFNLLVRLMVLAKKGQVVTQMNLANFLNANKMQVSKVLRTMEKKELVVRKKNPLDGRARSIVVTEKGLKTIDNVLTLVVKFDEGFFSILDNKDEFVTQLKKLF